MLPPPDTCPIRNVLNAVTGKWTLLILLQLQDHSMRFSEIRRGMGDITQRVLTQKLRVLEADGYLTRTVHAGPPIEVHYSLTPLGISFVEAIHPMVQWAAKNIDMVKENRATFEKMQRD